MNQLPIQIKNKRRNYHGRNKERMLKLFKVSGLLYKRLSPLQQRKTGALQRQPRRRGKSRLLRELVFPQPLQLEAKSRDDKSVSGAYRTAFGH